MMRQFKSVLGSAALIVLVFAPNQAAIAQQISPTVSTSAISTDGIMKTETRFDQSSKFAHHPSRVIVRFKNGAPSFLPGSGRAIELSRERNTHLVINPPGLSVRDVMARYRQNPNVVYAEPDYIVEAIGTSTPNDTLIAQQWDMTKISAPTVWGLASPPDASTTVVAIIDTGIDFSHPDLAANLYSEAGNPTVRGYTCSGGLCSAGGQDNHGHGTHVAGTIGATGNNALGIAGMNWSTTLLAIKFLDANGSGAISDAVAGFQKILALKDAGVNIRVTNNSWGGGGYSQALQDAMLAVEAKGILNVCAAGNSNVNADTSPMYPAAYDNRGIVSVLATDANDLGATFTNYGVASVDIAAPGVSILSTAASGACSLCDASGYKVLSGTSMASPHVAGAAVSMMAAYPFLTASQARDALLNPMNYDALTDDKSRRTSSGGRLNFSKLIANAGQFSSLPLNQFPRVAVGPDAFVAPGGIIGFTQSVNDPDDNHLSLRSFVGRGPVSSWTAWLFGWRANTLFPSMGATPFVAPDITRVAAMPYDISVSDNRGGGAMARNWAVVTPAVSGSSVPAPVLSIAQTQPAAVGSTVTIGVSSPNTAWDINVSGSGSSSGWCCYSGSGISVTFNSAGTFRITSQAIDSKLNTSPTASTTIIVGAASNNPPISSFTLDKRSGTAPLTVAVNASTSSDIDGTISNYFFDCGAGYASGQTANTSTCTFTEPGTYWVRVLLTDNSGMMGVSSDYVVVTPPQPGSDISPPQVSFIGPSANSTLITPTTIDVKAIDDKAVTDVTFILDQIVLATLTNTGSGTTYSLVFDPSKYSVGPHNLSVSAKDLSGNVSTTAVLPISIAAPILPAILMSPGGAVTVQRNKTRSFSVTLSNTPTYGLNRVDYVLTNTKTGAIIETKSVTAPYSYTFRSSTNAGTYTLLAKPYDSKSQLGKSASASISVK